MCPACQPRFAPLNLLVDFLDCIAICRHCRPDVMAGIMPCMTVVGVGKSSRVQTKSGMALAARVSSTWAKNPLPPSTWIAQGCGSERDRAPPPRSRLWLPPWCHGGPSPSPSGRRLREQTPLRAQQRQASRRVGTVLRSGSRSNEGAPTLVVTPALSFLAQLREI